MNSFKKSSNFVKKIIQNFIALKLSTVKRCPKANHKNGKTIISKDTNVDTQIQIKNDYSRRQKQRSSLKIIDKKKALYLKPNEWLSKLDVKTEQLRKLNNVT